MNKTIPQFQMRKVKVKHIPEPLDSTSQQSNNGKTYGFVIENQK
jgi:hypothetical protein